MAHFQMIKHLNKLIISHRANLKGPHSAIFGENHPSSIYNVIHQGFDVELDVWFIDNRFLLGHDNPEYEVDKSFFNDSKMWIHCKNVEALYQLLKLNTNVFYHDQDDCVLTSKGFIWHYPKNQILTDISIAVMPERVPNWDLTNAYGICTDFLLD